MIQDSKCEEAIDQPGTLFGIVKGMLQFTTTERPRNVC